MKGIAEAMHRGLGILAAALATFYGAWILGSVAIGVAVFTEYSCRLRLHTRKSLRHAVWLHGGPRQRPDAKSRLSGCADRPLKQSQTGSVTLMTNARRKLNSAAIHGSLLIAGLIAALTQSWIVFMVILGTLLTTAVVSGEIRLKKRPR